MPLQKTTGRGSAIVAPNRITNMRGNAIEDIAAIGIHVRHSVRYCTESDPWKESYALLSESMATQVKQQSHKPWLGIGRP